MFAYQALSTVSVCVIFRYELTTDCLSNRLACWYQLYLQATEGFGEIDISAMLKILMLNKFNDKRFIFQEHLSLVIG